MIQITDQSIEVTQKVADLEKLVRPLMLTIEINKQKAAKEADALRKLCLEKDIEQKRAVEEQILRIEKFDRDLQQMDIDEKIQRTMTILNQLIAETSQQNFETRNRWQRLYDSTNEFVDSQKKKNEEFEEELYVCRRDIRSWGDRLSRKVDQSEVE